MVYPADGAHTDIGKRKLANGVLGRKLLIKQNTEKAA